MTTMTGVAALLAGALLIYLGFALLFPERLT